jgi:hypothetical protein
VVISNSTSEVAELRSLFRYLQEFRSLYENQGTDEIVGPSGVIWSLWDLDYLYSQARKILTDPQYRALTLFLVHDAREQDAAEMMGVSRTNPIGMYATLGLTQLVRYIERGEVERFRLERSTPPSTVRMPDQAHWQKIASDLRRARTRITLTGCWQFPTLPGQSARIGFRSPTAPSGILYVHPRTVMYLAEVGPIPPDHEVEHQNWRDPHHPACFNPGHTQLVRRSTARRVP